MHRDLAWELGPGTISEHVLVVSAEGAPELRPIARRWLLAAPPTDRIWAYADTRQPTTDLGWTLEVDGHQVTASDVAVQWTVDEDRACVDVVVHHPAFGSMPVGTRDQVAFLLLDHGVGEEAVETWIGEVSSSAVRPEPAGDLGQLRSVVGRLADSHSGPEPTWQLMSGQTPAGQAVLAMVRVPLRAASAPHLDAYVQIELPYTPGDDGSLPDDASLEHLRAVEDRVEEALGNDGRVLAHETTGGLRTVHVYADSATDAAARALEAVDAHSARNHRSTVTPDPGWQAVAHLRG